MHTSLTHPERQDVALDFFSRWEREVYAKHLNRSRQFARDAQRRHPHPFWTSRAAADVEPRDEEDADEAVQPGVVAAFERFKAASSIHLSLADDVRF